VKALDREGLLGEVIYGVLGAANRIDEAAVQVEVMRAYNDWMAEFCAFAARSGWSVSRACRRAIPQPRRTRSVALRGRGQRAVELAMTL
jgi:hypothetical protein